MMCVFAHFTWFVLRHAFRKAFCHDLLRLVGVLARSSIKGARLVGVRFVLVPCGFGAAGAAAAGRFFCWDFLAGGICSLPSRESVNR